MVGQCIIIDLHGGIIANHTTDNSAPTKGLQGYGLKMQITQTTIEEPGNGGNGITQTTFMEEII